MIKLNESKIVDGYEREWDALFSGGAFRLRYRRDPFLDEISEHLQNQDVHKILSVPCGDGINELYLCKKGFSLDCVDISSEALRKFKRRIGRRPRVAVYKFDAFKLSEKFQNAEAILSLDFIFHISPKLGEFLSQVTRSLKPGGVLIFNFYTPLDDSYQHGKKIGKKTYKVIPNILIKYFTLDEIKRAVEDAGLTLTLVTEYVRKDKTHYGFRREKGDFHTHRGYLVYCTKKVNGDERQKTAI